MVVAAAFLAGCGADAASPGEEAAPAAAPHDFVGLVSEDVLAGEGDYRRRTLDRQRRAGVSLLRQTFDWSLIEQQPGEYDFAFFDDYVHALAEAGMDVLPILFRPPPFHSAAPADADGRATYPPREEGAMARFAAAAVRRYGPGGTLWRDRPDVPERPIRSWQIWNEPNLPIYWGMRPRAGEYAALLDAVATAIRREDPDAEIVTAGLPNSRLGTPFREYVGALYKAGAADSFDTLAIHPYARTADGLVQAVGDARGLLEDHDDGDKPIWVTEFGWASQGPESPFTLGHERQARQIARAVERLGREREPLQVRGFAYFSWKDAEPYDGGRDFWGLHTGLLTIEGEPKPALEAFSRVAQRVSR
jgi:hypothetical protein